MVFSDLNLRKVLSIILGGMIGASVAACGSVPGASTLHRLTAPTSQNITISSRARTERLYIVRKGDTLYSVAKSFKVDPMALAMINDVKDGATIRPNQKLRIPR